MARLTPHDERDALAVIETDDAFLVAFGGDPADWVAAFARRGDFPARAWAERMAALYNLRRSAGRDGEQAMQEVKAHGGR